MRQSLLEVRTWSRIGNFFDTGVCNLRHDARLRGSYTFELIPSN